MGPDGFPVEQGFTHVGISQQYDTAKGYGWLHAPVAAFDTSNTKLHSQSLRSGVWGKDSLVFKANVPNGNYHLILSVGNKDSVNMKMQIYVDGQLISQEIVAPWYRLAYRTVRWRCDIADGQVEIKIKGNGTDVGLYGIEIRPVSYVKNIKSGLEQDTALMKEIRTGLLDKLKSDSANAGVLNQLDIINKYLLACYYYNGGGWSWASKETGFSLIYRMFAAADLLEQIASDPQDPLYERSMYLLGRIYYWLDKEDNNPMLEGYAKKIFKELNEKHPDDQIIRMYMDEKIANDEYKSTVVNGTAPAWALHQQEAMGRLLELIHWWVINRQAPNGEMGGKYGDDVELLRWWLPAVLGTDDSIARTGYTRLADGVWNSGILERGFAKRVDDVEHSAELFRDTHPGMFLVKYGDPEYVERCMTSMKNFRDVWTGITSIGHRHFKSYYLSATEVVAQYPYDVDVALNARALLPGLWAAWYSGNPTIMRLFNEWGKAWIEDAARAANGKPAGVLPSAVAFDGDKIGGHSRKWYDAGLTYNYYNWDHVGHVNELQYHLIGMYKLTGNEIFLKTINFYNDLLLAGKKETSNSSAVPGSLDWVKMQLMQGGDDGDAVYHPMGKLFGMAKQLTMQHRYDSLVLQYGHPYNRFLLTHDTATIVSGLKNIIEALRYNWPLLTSEVKFTDRVYVPGSNLLMGMYTGHFGAGYEYPALAVSWKNTGNDVAVFVQNNSSKSFKTLLYNFGKEKELGVRTWQLEPGEYGLELGTDLNGDGNIDEILQSTTVELKERVNDLSIQIPSGKTLLLKLEQLKQFPGAAGAKTDLAINARDIVLEKTGDQLQLSVLVHNIGNQSAKNISISLTAEGEQVQTSAIPQIDPPDNLDQQTKPVIFTLKAFSGSKKLVLTVHTNQPEITSLNNKVEATLENKGGEIRVSL